MCRNSKKGKHKLSALREDEILISSGVRAMHADTVFPHATGRANSLVLVSEISHRVVNEYTQAIACIRLAAADAASAEARAVLTQAATKLRYFADAHRALQLPRSAEAVDLGEYLTRLCAASMAAGLQDRGVRLNLSCDTIQLGSERCWRVALIISELVTNSVRHGLRGGPGQVLIELSEDDGLVTCRVSDDGLAEPAPQPARGLCVVKALTAELEGEVCWRFGAFGTTAVLTFPKDELGRGA
jgi:two-component sensor histidine kinase